MRSFNYSNLWLARLQNKELDSFYRLVFATMKADTPDERYRSLIYVYKKTIATKMRREGFKFRPVFRLNRNEPTKNKCDYDMSLDITGKHLKLEITI